MKNFMIGADAPQDNYDGSGISPDASLSDGGNLDITDALQESKKPEPDGEKADVNTNLNTTLNLSNGDDSDDSDDSESGTMGKMLIPIALLLAIFIYSRKK